MFVFLLILCFIETLRSDRKEWKKTTKMGKFVYVLVTSQVLVLLVTGIYGIDVMFITHWIIYDVGPAVHTLMNNVQ